MQKIKRILSTIFFSPLDDKMPNIQEKSKPTEEKQVPTPLKNIPNANINNSNSNLKQPIVNLKSPIGINKPPTSHIKYPISKSVVPVKNDLKKYSAPIPARKQHSPKPRRSTDFVTMNKIFPITGVGLSDPNRPRTPANLYYTPFSYEKYKKFKQVAMEAYQNEKIFTIVGNFNTLRYELQKRGWVEKYYNNRNDHLTALSQYDLLRLAHEGNDYEKIALSKLLIGCAPNFIWQPRYNQDFNRGSNYYPLRNRIPRKTLNFTAKEGLSECNEYSHWYYIPNRSDLNCPRSYRLSISESVHDFLEDYRITTCLCFLNYLLDQKDDVYKLCTKGGLVSTTSIDFAIRRLNEWINMQNHEDIDVLPYYNPDRIFSIDWHAFYKQYRGIVHFDERFHEMFPEVIEKYMTTARKIVDTFLELNPRYKADGYYNLWIVKPSLMSRGNGIQLMSDDTKILNFVDKHKRQYRYVVQKYIEKPLLIYKTKFDIRQYVLITVDGAVLIWMYKNCYLRFSSQEFRLKDCSESIHLTNHAIQRKYANGIRHSALPNNNMWCLDDFKKYLKSIDKGDVWENKIYPGMKQCIVATILCSFDEVDYEKNCFELYGLDFMIDENFEPYLIEINSSPDLSHSTHVTAIICKQVLVDLVKVVVDRYDFPTTATGDFELIDRIDIPKLPTYCGSLCVNGETIKQPNQRVQPVIAKTQHHPQTLTNKNILSYNNKRFREAGLIPDGSGNLKVMTKDYVKSAPKHKTALHSKINSIIKSQPRKSIQTRPHSADIKKIDFIERNKEQIHKRKIEFERLKLLKKIW